MSRGRSNAPAGAFPPLLSSSGRAVTHRAGRWRQSAAANWRARSRAASPATIVIVDNCYGELVDETEPPAHGADLIAGIADQESGRRHRARRRLRRGRRETGRAGGRASLCAGSGRRRGFVARLRAAIRAGLYFTRRWWSREALAGLDFAAALFRGTRLRASTRSRAPSAMTSSRRFASGRGPGSRHSHGACRWPCPSTHVSHRSPGRSPDTLTP